MHKGHLLDLKMIIPFSREKLSEGKPSMFHCLIVTGFPRTVTKEKCYEPGIYFYLVSLIHSSMMEVLKAAVKAPR